MFKVKLMAKILNDISKQPHPIIFNNLNYINLYLYNNFQYKLILLYYYYIIILYINNKLILSF